MIEIYYSPGCDSCIKAKEFMDKMHIHYKAIDLTEKKNRKEREEFRKLGVDVLPVIKGLTIDGVDTILFGWKESHKKKLRQNSYELSKKDEETIKKRLKELGYLQ